MCLVYVYVYSCCFIPTECECNGHATSCQFDPEAGTSVCNNCTVCAVRKYGLVLRDILIFVVVIHDI